MQFHEKWGEFTGKDLAYMWKDITSPESTHGQTTYWRTAVKDVEVPSDHEVVYRLKREFPDLTIVINGGVTHDDDIAAHLQQVDGVMVGRQAYHEPWQMHGWDRRF